MSNFRRTSEALNGWRANRPVTPGSHIDPELTTGVPSNRIVGETPFDPQTHDPYDIDHMSLMGAATGELYVPIVQPERPMAAHVIVDQSARREHPAVSDVKQDLASNITRAFRRAMPGMLDSLVEIRIVSETAEGRRRREIQKVRAGLSLAEIAVATSTQDLKILISDFGSRHFDLGAAAKAKIGPMVAVKLNHPLQLRLPANVGPINLYGGEGEFDTSNRRKLAKKNAELAEAHAEIVDRLTAAGVEVASILTDKREPRGYDARQADLAIASAIKRLQKKHNL